MAVPGSLPFGGVITLPIFDSRADFTPLSSRGLGPSLQNQSCEPLVETVFKSIGGTNIDGAVSPIFCIDVPSRGGGISLTATPGNNGTPLGVLSYCNNTVYSLAQGQHGTFNIGSQVQFATPGENIGFYGIENFNPEALEDSVFGGSPSNNSVVQIARYGGAVIASGFWTGNNFDGIVRPFYIDSTGPFSGPKFDNLFDNGIVGSGVQVLIPADASNNTFDNCCIFPNAPYGENRPIALQWQSINSNYNVTIINIDDDGMPGELNDLLAVANPQGSNNGYIFTLPTNGGGPTGMPYEIVLIDPQIEAWYLIALVAQDAASAQALNGGGAGGDWQFKIDNQGIAWFTPNISALGDKIFTSYSALNPLYPWIQPGLLNPIVLPCYNVCNPVSYCLP